MKKVKQFFQHLFIVLTASLAVAGVYTWKVRPAVANDEPHSGGSQQIIATSLEEEEEAEEVVAPPESEARTYTPAEGAVIDSATLPMLRSLNEEFASLARAVMPSVVSITTSTRMSREDHPFFGQEGLERFFGPMPRERTALGSGVVVTEEGHVITNYHVIRGVDEITVTLDDGSTTQAEVVAEDPVMDLAVLMIEADNLRPLPLGDSDQVEVGEIVFAIGNPFMLHQTVTQGIISAKGRMGIVDNPSDFLQTNAEINPGNSGGPLVNWRGEVVGINTAISSRTGAWQGVGFAIPSNLVRQALESVSRHGRILRGFLGVVIQDLTPELAEGFGLDSTDGALVSDVMEDSPAAQAGVERGDVIIGFDGRPIKEFTDLRRMVTQTDVGSEVPVRVIRDGEEVVLNATIEELDGETRTAAVPGRPSERAELPGVTVEDISSRLRRELNLDAEVEGVVVTRVDSESPSAGELRPGDVIEEVNRRPVRNRAQFREALSELSGRDSLVLSVNREGSRSFVVVSMKED